MNQLDRESEIELIKRCIFQILLGEDHRELYDQQISREFLIDAIDIFKKVVSSKPRSLTSDLNWYKEAFIENEYDKMSQAAHGGTSLKAITNRRHTQRKDVVLQESLRSFELLQSVVNTVKKSDISLNISISYNDLTKNLDLSESLVLIHALAMRRNQIRGGNWSSLGKQIEKPLLDSMCRIFKIPSENFAGGHRREIREVDFALFDIHGNQKKCEVKLMGKGNPEGADSLYARDTDVFIASTLSNTNITQLDESAIEWVELNTRFGFLRFGDVLQRLNIPHSPVKLSEESLEELIYQTVNELELE